MAYRERLTGWTPPEWPRPDLLEDRALLGSNPSARTVPVRERPATVPAPTFEAVATYECRCRPAADDALTALVRSRSRARAGEWDLARRHEARAESRRGKDVTMGP